MLVFSLQERVFFEPSKTYFRFQSSDKKTTLVVQEKSWLFGGWSNLFLEEKPYLLKSLDADILTDDGYTLFSNEDY